MGATRGFSGAPTAEVHSRIRTLAERGVGAKSLPVFMGLWGTATMRGEARTALALADQILQIARDTDSPSAFAAAHYAQGLTRHVLGDLVGARQHFQQAIEQYREEDFAGIAQDPGVVSHTFVAINEWQLGHPDSAVRHAKEAIALASRQKNPIALAGAFTLGAGTVYGRCGDFRRTVEASDEGVRMSTELNLQQHSAIGKINGAWARAKMREVGGAVDRIREGLAELNPQQAHVGSARYLCQLSETQQIVGALDDAFVTIEQALQTNPDVLVYRPELLRHRALLKLQKGSRSGDHFESAERDFREAIELAQGMEAKSPELQVTISLARLLRDTGRRDEAREMLADIYNWFTEGFDTADLKDAKSLLDQLSN
jgi:tetratricopeptide (TPR) repeat protein